MEIAPNPSNWDLVSSMLGIYSSCVHTLLSSEIKRSNRDTLDRDGTQLGIANKNHKGPYPAVWPFVPDSWRFEPGHFSAVKSIEKIIKDEKLKMNTEKWIFQKSNFEFYIQSYYFKMCFFVKFLTPFSIFDPIMTLFCS